MHCCQTTAESPVAETGFDLSSAWISRVEKRETVWLHGSAKHAITPRTLLNGWSAEPLTPLLLHVGGGVFTNGLFPTLCNDIDK